MPYLLNNSAKEKAGAFLVSGDLQSGNILQLGARDGYALLLFDRHELRRVSLGADSHERD